eukprot:gene4460-8882_t
MKYSSTIPLHIFIIFAVVRKNYCYKINGTGGTFPDALYQEATFSYEFVQSQNIVSYFAGGSTTGKCNIMGYWHTGNSNPHGSAPPLQILKRDSLICTDKCTGLSVSVCGNDSSKYPRFDHSKRTPIVDLGASDAILDKSDYKAFPDLQMLPAVAGAVVPIYNIPELKNLNSQLILSRSTIADIFLGNIKNWNDPRLLAINVPPVNTTLAKLNKPIKVAVRTDSSGTSDIFSSALCQFDPKGQHTPDFSFAAVVGSGEKPMWCGPKTDEVQVLTITSCNHSYNAFDRTIRLKVVTPSYALTEISFLCDDSGDTVRQAFETAFGSGQILVTRSVLSPLSYAFTVGYWGSKMTMRNWYEPYVITSSSSVTTVTVATLQEGGFWNSHFNSSAYSVTAESQSVWVWVNSSSSTSTTTSTSFSLSNPNSVNSPSARSSNITVSTTDLSNAIKVALSTIAPGLVKTVKRIRHNGWDEYQLSFNTSKPNPVRPKQFILYETTTSTGTGALPRQRNVAITTLLHASNYPFFYDSTRPQGYASSGKYTCYKHDHYLQEWNYYTGQGNLGVIAEVKGLDYSIGYSVLTDAMQNSVAMASLINRAGNVISPNSTGVTYAVMEKGGSLNKFFNADISDGYSARVWPIVGYTYWIIRTATHLGSCDERKRAMKFLHSFYYSDAVTQIAARLGFSTLPSFIRDIVVNQLVATAKCNSGEYVFNKTTQLPIVATELISSPMKTYLSAFFNLDKESKWNLTRTEDSMSLWSQYSRSPNDYVGVATAFASKAQKLQVYHQTGDRSSSSSTDIGSNVITTAFAHIAIVPIYNLNSFSKASGPLRVTSELLAAIYTGSIRYWNDSLIQQANWDNRRYLPFQKIIVVVRSVPNDVNAVFTRFMSLGSSAFASAYSVGENGVRLFNAASYISADRLKLAVDNDHVDSFVTFTDGAIGYFAQVGAPNSPTASFCPDANCKNIVAPNNPANLAACETDPNTVVQLPYGTTYDLLVSQAEGCYPMVSTVDYSTLVDTSPDTCATGALGMVNRRVLFSSWLYNGTALTVPLTALLIQGSQTSLRTAAYSKICNIQCGGKALGYTYCGFRDCEWQSHGAGDYIQHVSSCNAMNDQRTVSYSITTGNTCIQRPDDRLRDIQFIDCDHVSMTSSIGIACYTIMIIGELMTLYVVYKTVRNKGNKKIKKSQPVFVFVFLGGAVFLHFTILPFMGQRTDVNCIAEIWLYNIAMTMVYGPLVMKLATVEKLVYTSKLKKVRITALTVISEVAVLVLVDVIILLAWTLVRPPLAIHVDQVYEGVMAPVDDVNCDRSMDNPFVVVMVAYKCLLLGFGLTKAICTWHVESSVSESKQFSVALAIGVVSYIMSSFFALNAIQGVLMQCILNFMCSVLSVFLIMLPKFAKNSNVLTKTMISGLKVSKGSGSNGLYRSGPNGPDGSAPNGRPNGSDPNNGPNGSDPNNGPNGSDPNNGPNGSGTNGTAPKVVNGSIEINSGDSGGTSVVESHVAVEMTSSTKAWPIAMMTNPFWRIISVAAGGMYNICVPPRRPPVYHSTTS